MKAYYKLGLYSRHLGYSDKTNTDLCPWGIYILVGERQKIINIYQYDKRGYVYGKNRSGIMRKPSVGLDYGKKRNSCKFPARDLPFGGAGVVTDINYSHDLETLRQVININWPQGVSVSSLFWGYREVLAGKTQRKPSTQPAKGSQR